MRTVILLALLPALLAACKGSDTHSPVATPGAPTTGATAALDKGAGLLQSKPPIAALNSYIDGFHFSNSNMKQQMEAHHYCAILSDDLIQCVIYDGNLADAKLMGVEYIVSATLFQTLPAAEKALWHSHVHEVKSGQLIAPGLPAAAELALMTRLVGTYGKTWHTWHTSQHDGLPLGMPQLMMGFTADGQADPAMVAARDARFEVSSAALRQQRAAIPAPAIDPGADTWQHGASSTAPAGAQ